MKHSPHGLLSINNYFCPLGGAAVAFLEQNRMRRPAGRAVRDAASAKSAHATGRYFPTRLNSAGAVRRKSRSCGLAFDIADPARRRDSGGHDRVRSRARLSCARSSSHRRSMRMRRSRYSKLTRLRGR